MGAENVSLGTCNETSSDDVSIAKNAPSGKAGAFFLAVRATSTTGLLVHAGAKGGGREGEGGGVTEPSAMRAAALRRLPAVHGPSLEEVICLRPYPV